MSHSPLAKAVLDSAFLRTVYRCLEEETRLRWTEQCLQEGTWSPEHERAYAEDVLAWPQIAASTRIRVRSDAGSQRLGLRRWLRLMFGLGVPVDDEDASAADIHAMARQKFYLLVTLEQQRLVDRTLAVVRKLEPALGAVMTSRARQQRVTFHQRGEMV